MDEYLYTLNKLSNMKISTSFFLGILFVTHISANDTLSETLTGRYYLQGAMEMGSELFLRNDGSFEAAISFGSIDGYAKGNWSQAEQRLTLHRQTYGMALQDDLGQLFDGMVLHIHPNCLAIEEMDGCYVKSPARKSAE